MKKLTQFFLFLLPFSAIAQYNGTASVSQGPATATTGNLYNCSGGRIAKLGTITASNGTVWTVPAEVNFTNTAFPFASNLNNACAGANYANATAALAALNGSDIVTIDPDGELITGFIFADNYFELYINGTPVGKDNVPYTQFNSNIVRFKVKRPFTIAMLLVDWEENLGIGSEANGGSAYHDGDGGMVAVFKNADNQTIAITDHNWKAQTFYTAPITNLSCPTENGAQRLSNNCSTADSNNGSAYYALHWPVPANWMQAGYDDSNWPAATEYTNATIGVNNKPAYTNFTDIFDAPAQDAIFIWSTNVILDNEVIVRHTVPAVTGTLEQETPGQGYRIFPNPFDSKIRFEPSIGQETAVLTDTFGKIIYAGNDIENQDFTNLSNGIYFLKIAGNKPLTFKIVKQ
ncbi:MAG: T9SS type A sorting domain-containing protein [Bacteroidota bacterium]